MEVSYNWLLSPQPTNRWSWLPPFKGPMSQRLLHPNPFSITLAVTSCLLAVAFAGDSFPPLSLYCGSGGFNVHDTIIDGACAVNGDATLNTFYGGATLTPPYGKPLSRPVINGGLLNRVVFDPLSWQRMAHHNANMIYLACMIDSGLKPSQMHLSQTLVSVSVSVSSPAQRSFSLPRSTHDIVDTSRPKI